MDQSSNDQLDELGLHFDNDARRALFETSKWARFIAVVIFIGCGLFLVFILFAGSRIISLFQNSFFTSLGESGVVFIVAAIAALLALVVATYYFLFNFSMKMKDGLLTENTASINAGFASLKIYFIITTAIAILSLAAAVYEALVK